MHNPFARRMQDCNAVGINSKTCRGANPLRGLEPVSSEDSSQSTLQVNKFSEG